MIEKEIREFAKENYIPIVREKTCELLVEKIKEVNPSKILEVGTAIGYSGIKMLQNSNATLVTLENDEERKNLALENFEKENLTKRATVVFGDAFNYIASTTEKFDFIFLDGPKGQYNKYLPFLIESLQKNGVMFCDNVLFSGFVLSDEDVPKKHRTMVNNLRKFLSSCKILQQQGVVLCELINVEDGILIVKKIKD